MDIEHKSPTHTVSSGQQVGAGLDTVRPPCLQHTSRPGKLGAVDGRPSRHVSGAEYTKYSWGG